GASEGDGRGEAATAVERGIEGSRQRLFPASSPSAIGPRNQRHRSDCPSPGFHRALGSGAQRSALGHADRGGTIVRITACGGAVPVLADRLAVGAGAASRAFTEKVASAPEIRAVAPVGDTMFIAEEAETVYRVLRKWGGSPLRRAV